MSKLRSRLFVFLLTAFLVCLCAIPVSALTINGSANGGVNGAGTHAAGSYGISGSDTSGNTASAYRFTIVDGVGARKYAPIDVFRNARGLISYNKFSTKFTKTEYAANYTKTSFTNTTTTSSTDCYYDTALGITLPSATTGMEGWIDEINLNKILIKHGSNVNFSSVSKAGYCILIEPMYPITVDGTTYVLTVTEMAFLTGSRIGWNTQPKWITGADNNAFCFIAQYTNGYFPNSLMLEETKFGLTASAKLTDDNTGPWGSAATIITKGYGAMIVLDENAQATTTPKYTIAFNGNGHTGGSTASMSMTYGVAKNLTANGFTRTGYTFAGWNTAANGSGTAYANQASVNNLTTTNGATVTLYAQWTPNRVNISYRANGGTVSASGYTTNQYGVILYNGSDGFHYSNYGSTDDPYNATTFGLTKPGYYFAGWVVRGNTSLVLDQDTNYDSTKYTQHDDNTKSTVNTNGVYCVLDAKWVPNSYTNTIVHWKYVGTGGDNSSGTYKKMGTSTFTGTYNSNVTIPKDKIQSYTGYYNTGVANSPWGTDTWSSKPIGSTFVQPASGVTIEYYYQPTTYTNTIYHVILGAGDPRYVGTSTVQGTYGASVTIPKDKIQSYTGYHNTGDAHGRWGTDTWSSKEIGSSFTQPSAGINIDYYYYPNSYTVSYNGNGATGGATASSSHVYNNEIVSNGEYYANYEFMKTGHDLAPIIDKHGTGKYLIEFDLYSDVAGTMQVYMQNGSASKYKMSKTFSSTTSWKRYSFVVDVTNGETSETNSMLAFYGTYGTGNKPHVKNIVFTKCDEKLTANGFTRSGYTFAGWNTKADGTGTAYANQASVKNLTATNGATVTLYAQWVKNSYTITFDKNTTDTVNNLPAPITTTESSIDFPQTPATRTGYTLVSWNTKADGTGTSYDAKCKGYPVTGNITLYAQWNAVPYFKDSEGNRVEKGEITLLKGTLFDPMSYVTAEDVEDGDLTGDISIVYNNVPVDADGKINTVGSGYTVEYSVADSHGATGKYILTVNVVDVSSGSASGQIRFIKKNYLHTLLLNSKWKLEPLKTFLQNVLSNDLKDDSGCEQVWHFTADDIVGTKDKPGIRQWCLDRKKGTETNKSFILEFAEKHRKTP